MPASFHDRCLLLGVGVFKALVSVRRTHASRALLDQLIRGVAYAGAPCFHYETFRSLTALVPEVKNARPSGGPSRSGFQRWPQGQMQLTNPEQYRTEADFNGDGKMDIALPFKSEKGFHLLI